MQLRHITVMSVMCLLVAFGRDFDNNNALAETRTVHVGLVLMCDIYEITEENGRGGLARLAAAVKAERARQKNTLVFHAGDALSPSLLSGFDQGEHMMALMNTLGLDVFVPGNHEYDFGKEVFLKRMLEARFPLMAANLRNADGTVIPGFADIAMFPFEGINIGVVGLTAENSVKKSSPGDLRFESSVKTAERAVMALRERGADIVVAVAHAGRRMDLRLMRVEGIDVLLSGDDHDLVVLYDGETAMVEAMQEAEVVTTVDLEITVKEDKGKRRVSWRPRFRILDTADVTPDAEMEERLKPYLDMLSQELDVVLGHTDTELDTRKPAVRTGESAIGNLIADALRIATKSDIGLVNGGSIRGNKVYAPGGAITRRDILAELPFRNFTMKVELTGKDLLAVLENGMWYAGKANGRFAHVSGLKLVVDTNKRPGERIVSAMVNGQPLDPAARYTVATNDFIARGAEGYDAFKNGTVILGKTDGKLIANDVMAHIRKAGRVAPKVEGRIVMR